MRRYKSRWYRMFLFSSSSSWSSSTNDTMCVWWQMYVSKVPTQTQLGKPAVCPQCTYLCMCVCMSDIHSIETQSLFTIFRVLISGWISSFFSGPITANINVIEWSIQKNINAVSVLCVCVYVCVRMYIYTRKCWHKSNWKRIVFLCFLITQKKNNQYCYRYFGRFPSLLNFTTFLRIIMYIWTIWTNTPRNTLIKLKLNGFIEIYCRSWIKRVIYDNLIIIWKLLSRNYALRNIWWFMTLPTLDVIFFF